MCLHRIADPVDTRGIGLSDCLMSGLAVFPSRMPSPLGPAAAGGPPGTGRPGRRGRGSVQVQERFRPWPQPSGGRPPDARHARVPDRPGPAAPLSAVRLGAAVPEAQPMPVEQAEGAG